MPPGAARDLARAQIAERGAAVGAIEAIVRQAMPTLPIPLVERSRGLLRRFFSTGPWTVDDDVALASAVGPGEGWFAHEAAPGLVVHFGWRGGVFRLTADADGIETTTVAGPGDPEPHAAGGGDAVPDDDTPLLRSFDGPVVPVAQPSPRLCRFVTPTGAATSTAWVRDPARAGDTRVRAVLETAPGIVAAQLGPGFVAVEVDDPARWRDVVAPLLATIQDRFAPAAPAPPPDRAQSRAAAALGGLDPRRPRDLARLVDATTSPDAAERAVAVSRIAGADPRTEHRVLGRALDDDNRPVRRAAADVLVRLAAAGRRDIGDLLARALRDADARVRYQAVRGLVRLGRTAELGDVVDRDPDLRVRVAAAAARAGSPIP